MKKIIQSLFLGIAAIAMVSCNNDNNPNEDKFNDNPDVGYITFETPGELINVRSNDVTCGGVSELEIPIVLKSTIGDFYPFPNTPTNENGFDIDYTITDIVGNSSSLDFEVVFPSGTSEGVMLVTIPENITDDVEFKVTLNGTSNSNVTIGQLDDTTVQEVTVRINKSNRGLLYGTYDVVQTSSGTAPIVYESVVSPGANANEVIITNLFNQIAAVPSVETETTVIINNDGTLSFPAFLDNLLFTSPSSNIGNVYFEGQNGTYETCEGNIEIDFRLRIGPNQNPIAPVNVVLTRR